MQWKRSLPPTWGELEDATAADSIDALDVSSAVDALEALSAADALLPLSDSKVVQTPKWSLTSSLQTSSLTWSLTWSP